MSHSEQINEIAAALAKAQAEMKAAKFDAVNPHFKSKYATLAAVQEAIRPLSKHGISYTQTEELSDGGDNAWLETLLIHTSGQWIRSRHPLPIGVKPQEFGSALTYARRYSLAAIVGIASDEDDDANAAQTAKPPLQMIEPPKVEPATGKPRSLEFADNKDGWAWFAQQMVALSKTPEWEEWKAANNINISKMENEFPKTHARMLAAIKMAA